VLMKFLLTVCCGINGVLQNGNTALLMAAQEGYTDIVQLLMEAGADVNVQSKVHLLLHLYCCFKEALSAESA
jgi:ankyrin repeat protein